MTDRQREIIEHAIEMIGESGLASLTMRRLSLRLGVSEPALYRHFENKTAILAAILNTLEAETYERIPLDNNATPDALITHFERLFALLTARPALASVVFLDEFITSDPELQEMVNTLLTKNRERLARAMASIGHLVHGGLDPVPDTDSLATLLLGGVRLLIRQWRLDACGWNLTERGKRLVETLVHALSGHAG